MKPLKVLLALVALASALPNDAAGHQRSLSYSTWRLDGDGARVTARVSQLDLSRLGLAFRSSGGAEDPVGAHLVRSLRLRAGEEPCAAAGPPLLREAPEGWVLYAWRVACAGDGPRSVETSLFLEVAPSHLHFARVDATGRGARERVLTGETPRWTLPGASPGAPGPDPGDAPGGVAAYVGLGVEHILTGWDHLAFVVALLLLAGTLGEVAALVTAFTVAHSITLGLATLGWVQPSSAAVEALIGFSIALVAAENGWILSGRDRLVPVCVVGGLLLMLLLPGAAVSRAALLGLALFSLCHFGLLRVSPRPARLRAAVAFGFGLVHGFGFAGILSALELPVERVVPALFGFNVGVELGQLGVVALVWPLLRGLAHVAAGRPARWVAEAGSAAICGLGLYWFVTRSFAG